MLLCAVGIRWASSRRGAEVGAPCVGLGGAGAQVEGGGGGSKWQVTWLPAVVDVWAVPCEHGSKPVVPAGPWRGDGWCALRIHHVGFQSHPQRAVLQLHRGAVFLAESGSVYFMSTVMGKTIRTIYLASKVIYCKAWILNVEVPDAPSF